MRAAIGLLLLASCNQWVRPTPPPPSARTVEEQWKSAVTIRSSCDPFEDGALSKNRAGTGVMVSDWQVLTAIHVVDCQSAVPTIRVSTVTGQVWRMAPEREWELTGKSKRDGVARLQLMSADSFDPRLGTPAIRGEIPELWEPLYLDAAHPFRKEVIGEASGWEYGGAGYGGTLFTYVAATTEGNSGSPIYDIDGHLVGLHLGVSDGAGFARMLTPDGYSTSEEPLRYGVLVTPEMVPHK